MTVWIDLNITIIHIIIFIIRYLWFIRWVRFRFWYWAVGIQFFFLSDCLDKNKRAFNKNWFRVYVYVSFSLSTSAMAVCEKGWWRGYACRTYSSYIAITLIEFKSNLNSFYDKSNQLKPIEILKLIKCLKQYAWKMRQRITLNSYRHTRNKFGRTLGFILFSYTFRTKSLFPTNWLVSVTWIVLNLDFIPKFWKMLFKRKPT